MIQDIAPHRFHNEFDPAAAASDTSPVFCFEETGFYCRMEEDRLVLPRPADLGADPADCNFLFRLDGTDFFLCREKKAEPEGFVLQDVRHTRNMTMYPREQVFAAMTARQLAYWYRDNRFCGTCGHETSLGTKERSIVCPACGRTIYPRIVPAVIVGVTRGDEIVLTKYRGRDIPFYALVAGFTEIGETLEETVRREVMEEVGLEVTNIRYYKSQPWAIADDILSGFYCDAVGDPTIRMDASELKQALWVRREDVQLQPNDYSLTNEMMLMFKEGKEPR